MAERHGAVARGQTDRTTCRAPTEAAARADECAISAQITAAGARTEPGDGVGRRHRTAPGADGQDVAARKMKPRMPSVAPDRYHSAADRAHARPQRRRARDDQAQRGTIDLPAKLDEHGRPQRCAEQPHEPLHPPQRRFAVLRDEPAGGERATARPPERPRRPARRTSSPDYRATQEHHADESQVAAARSRAPCHVRTVDARPTASWIESSANGGSPRSAPRNSNAPPTTRSARSPPTSIEWSRLGPTTPSRSSRAQNRR